MSGARDIIRNGLAQSDFDGGGHKLVNWDTSNLIFGEFGPQPAGMVFAGPELTVIPSAQDDEIPTFRPLRYWEVGAQAADQALTDISGSSVTTAGIGFLEIPDPITEGYAYNNGSDGGTHGWQTPAEVLVNIGAQPLNDTLTALSAFPNYTFSGTTFIEIPDAIQPGYPHHNGSDSGNPWSFYTAAEVAADIGAAISVAPFVDTTPLVKGSDNETRLFRIEVDAISDNTTRTMTVPNYNFTVASIAGSEALTSKIINGLTPRVGTAPGPDVDDDASFTETPANPYLFQLVTVATEGGSLTARLTAPTDVVFPTTGTLATVGGTIPASALDIRRDLGGKLSSNSKVPSQLAVQTYVNARLGSYMPPVPVDDIPSDTTIDVSFPTLNYEVLISGNTDIEAIIIDEGDEHLLVFDDVLIIVASATLITPGMRDIVTAADSYVIVIGRASGVSEIVFATDSEGSEQKSFTNIYLNKGGNIGFFDEASPFFEVGRGDDSDTGSFIRMTLGLGPRILKHDLSAGATFIVDSMTDIRELELPDRDGEIALTDHEPIAGGTTGQVLAKASNADYDFVWSAGGGGGTDVATDTIWNAKGDLAVGTGSDTASRLGVGANDTMLMAASGESTGIKWATPSEIRTALGLVINTTVQAWDADLDSWATVTRAAGFDTFAATPSSANFAALITGETGTAGGVVFSVAPVLTGLTTVDRLRIGAGTTALFPLKLTSGNLLTIPEAGSVEFLTDVLYFTTTTGPSRKTVAFSFNADDPVCVPYSYLDTDVTLAANSNLKVATQKAVRSFVVDSYQPLLGYTAENVVNKDTDGTLAANSDIKYPSQKAVKTYVDARIGGGAGKSGDLAISATGTTTLAPGVPSYIQWQQKATVTAGAGVYTHKIPISRADAVTGTMFHVRLEIAATDNPTIEFYDHTTGGTLLKTISGTADTAQVFIFTAVYTGAAWEEHESHFVF